MPQTEEHNLTVARAFIERFLGQGDLSVADRVLDENVQAITGLKPDGPIIGREQYKQLFSAFFEAFPPVSALIIEDMFAANDRVVVRFRSEQRHAKAFFGVAATNRIIIFLETHVMRLREGKIVENVVSATNLEFEMLMAPVLTPFILKEDLGHGRSDQQGV
jgi:predicted ester cyclase